MTYFLGRRTIFTCKGSDYDVNHKGNLTNQGCKRIICFICCSRLPHLFLSPVSNPASHPRPSLRSLHLHLEVSTRASAYPSCSIYPNILKPDIEGLRSHPFIAVHPPCPDAPTLPWKNGHLCKIIANLWINTNSYSNCSKRRRCPWHIFTTSPRELRSWDRPLVGGRRLHKTGGKLCSRLLRNCRVFFTSTLLTCNIFACALFNK